ncbi:nicotinamide mononucleotide transporter [Cyclobacterium lianum]|uniref:Nicotinamide riboside transporter PnuC n=1 Tax=Cyclobacterium lianum TaxID=388280 RepID=A0A1M7HTU2_9BACT|nr:nicotinamide riboside transporter PnuC [Cyclobacterium lianum]SHM31962.1 nicotinamide mononucleotide transporter [Cyclobacterium lianum]
MDWQYIVEGMHAGIQQMSWLEALAVFFGLASVYYSMRENILVFPTGIISTLIYVWICFQVRLYADMSINGYYFVMSVFGWYVWTHPRPGKASVPITWLDHRGILRALLLLLISYGLLYYVLRTYTDSDVPYWDSFTTASAFVGMWLMAKKKVENWIAWIITDLVSVPLYLYKGLLLTSFQFLVFTILAAMGLVAWVRLAAAYARDNG